MHQPTSLIDHVRRTLTSELSTWRRQQAAASPQAFASIYLGHHFTVPSSPMHAALFDLLLEVTQKRGRRVAVAAPRGHAKSTVLSLAYALWCALYGHDPFIWVVSSTKEQANGLLGHVKAELETNERLIADFREAVPGPGRARRPSPWRDRIVALPNGVVFRALSLDQQIRGLRNRQFRPSLIICDDVESHEQVQSEEQRIKMRRNFERALLKAGDERTNVIVVGTILHYDSLLIRLLDPNTSPGWIARRYKALLAEPENKDLWHQWEEIYCHRQKWQEESGTDAAKAFFQAHREEMVQGADVLWPEREPVEVLMEIRLREGPSSFDAEKQNEPLDPEKCLFRPEKMHYWDHRYTEAELLKEYSQEASIVGAWDPSLGKNPNKGDYSAIVILLKRWYAHEAYVLVADIGRYTPTDAIKRIVHYGKTYNIEQFYVENNNFQDVVMKDLGRAARNAKLQMSVHGFGSTGNKQARIQMLEPSITNGQLLLCRRHHELIEQLRQFPLGAHDDGPDALQMAMEVPASPPLRFRSINLFGNRPPDPLLDPVGFLKWM